MSSAAFRKLYYPIRFFTFLSGDVAILAPVYGSFERELCCFESDELEPESLVLDFLLGKFCWLYDVFKFLDDRFL